MSYKLVIPFPPTINNYYQRGTSGIFIKPKGRAFRLAVAEAIQEQAPGLNFVDPIAVEVVLFMPDKRKRDLDNYMKALLDAVTHSGLWVDDSIIDQLCVSRGEVLCYGSVLLSISDSKPVVRFAPLPD